MARRAYWLLASCLALWLAAGTAPAAELVVVEAHGLPLKPGTTLDGTKMLSLRPGQALTLLASNGQVMKLAGPYDAPPGDRVVDGGADLRSAITALATERQARTSAVGVVRGEKAVKLPDPWLVDVSHPGISCVRTGRPVVLWRAAPLNPVAVIFSPKDLSWHVSGTWPAAADRLAMPATMPLHDHTDYVIDLGGKLAPVTVRLIPTSVDNDAMRIGYMGAVGCGSQVSALLAVWQK